MEQVRALLFDVFGTVVDWRSGVIRDVTALAGQHGSILAAARAAHRAVSAQAHVGIDTALLLR